MKLFSIILVIMLTALVFVGCIGFDTNEIPNNPQDDNQNKNSVNRKNQ